MAWWPCNLKEGTDTCACAGVCFGLFAGVVLIACGAVRNSRRIGKVGEYLYSVHNSVELLHPANGQSVAHDDHLVGLNWWMKLDRVPPERRANSIGRIHFAAPLRRGAGQTVTNALLPTVGIA